jgi:hypothetical protein
LDEVGPTNCIPIAQLKGLAGGDASTSFLNRKSYGQSFVPRKDAQFIILSNHSPYEVYADKKKGRMDCTDMQAIEERFHVIRLDGPNTEERARFADVKVLTKYEFHEAMYEVLYDKNRFLNKHGMLTKGELRDALTESYRMYLDRHAHRKKSLNTRAFLLYMRSLLHEDDLPIYEQVHQDYAVTKCYTDNAGAVGETIVRVPVMQRPDTHVAPAEAPPAEDDAQSPDDAITHRFNEAMGKIAATRITSRPPSAADASSRLDPDKTHQGHVVVSNNGGPRQVIALESFHPPPHETAPFPPPMPPMHWVTDEFDRVPEEQRGGMDPDDDEMAAMKEMNW